MNEDIGATLILGILVLVFILAVALPRGNSEANLAEKISGALEGAKEWLLAHKWLISISGIFIAVVLISKWVNIQTGIFSALLLCILCVLVEWLPVWIPVLLGVIAAALFVKEIL